MGFARRRWGINRWSAIAYGIGAVLLCGNQTWAQQEEESSEPQRSGAQPPPLVVVSPPLDMGYVEPGGYTQGVITLLNDSEQTLQITGARGDCQCTVPVIHQMVLEPGQSTDMIVEFNAPVQLGRIFKKIFIGAEGFDSQLEVKFTADVENAVLVNGGRNRSLIEEPKGTFTLESIDKRPFRPLSVNGKPLVSENFTDFNPESDEPKEFYEVHYDFTDQHIDARPRWVVIETDRKGAELFVFPAFLKGNIAFPKSERWWPKPDVLVKPGIEAAVWTPMEIVMAGTLPKPGDSIRLSSSNPDLAVKVSDIGRPDHGPGIRIDFAVKPRWGYTGYITSALNFEMSDQFAIVEFFATVRPYEEEAPANQQGNR